jgi:hypothetical protein
MGKTRKVCDKQGMQQTTQCAKKERRKELRSEQAGISQREDNQGSLFLKFCSDSVCEMETKKATLQTRGKGSEWKQASIEG